MPLTVKHFDSRYYLEHVADGLDYLGHGEWQERYGRWLADVFGFEGQAILDVGCACGSVLEGLRKAGAFPACGVDLCEHMVKLGREKFPRLRLEVCDAVNLHLFNAGDFGFVHTAQSAEHWRSDLVYSILCELRRVARLGAWLFCALDTTEMYLRQGRRLEDEDPTHICVKPLAWWHDRLDDAGWIPDDGTMRAKLLGHPFSFFGEPYNYDWDYFLARKDDVA